MEHSYRLVGYRNDFNLREDVPGFPGGGDDVGYYLNDFWKLGVRSFSAILPFDFAVNGDMLLLHVFGFRTERRPTLEVNDVQSILHHLIAERT